MTSAKHHTTSPEPSWPRVRVTYSETDRMGHVYYANYLVWFEIGRNEYLRSIGQAYRDWEERHGIFLPVASCWIDYKKSAQYDDMVRIETEVAKLTRAAITFTYRIYNDATSDLLAEGGTRHAFVDREGKIARAAHRLLPDLYDKLNGSGKPVAD